MKKYINQILGRSVLLTLFLTGGYFFINKTFLYAEENLFSLQQDIIAAKQKHAAYAGKMNTIDEVIDQEKSQILQKEAQDLIDEISRSGYTSQRQPLAVEAPPQAPEKGSAEPQLSPEQQPPVDYNLKPKDFNVKPFDFKTGAQSKLPWIFKPIPNHLFYKDPPAALNEGESLYRVAISDGKITLKEAIDIGIANNMQAQALKKKIDVANAKWTEAKRAMFPTVQLQGDLNGGKSPGGGKFYKGEAYKINVNQPLYYGGELVLTAKQAEESVKSAKAEYDKAVGEYVHQVRTAYYGVVKAEYNVQYQLELSKEVSALYKMIKSGHDQRIVSEIDFLNMESQYQQTYFQVSSSQNDYQSAQLVLHQTLNFDSDAEIPVDLRLNFKKVDVNFHVMMELYLKNNADLKMKELAYISAKYGLQVYEAKKQPRFDLRGSYGYLGEALKDSETQADDKETGRSNSVIDIEKEWYLGIHGSMPLGANSVEYDQIKHVYGPTISAFQGSEDWRHTFKVNVLDRFSDITDEEGAKASLLQAEADLQKARFDAAVKLKDDFYNLQKSLIQMDSTIAKIQYQEKQNKILKYTMGLQEASVNSYLDGMIEQTQNRFAFIQSVTDYELALSSLSSSIGDPFYFDHEN